MFIAVISIVVANAPQTSSKILKQSEDAITTRYKISNIVLVRAQ